MTEEIKKCRRCEKPVVENFDNYGLFECMHWLCFHLEFEHGEYDPDRACSDPSCPLWQIDVDRDAVKALGGDPKQVMSEAIHERWG